MVGCCEHGNETSDSIKCWEFLHQLSNYHLLKKDSARWRHLSTITGNELGYSLDNMGSIPGRG
jgi:hypothetical protein